MHQLTLQCIKKFTDILSFSRNSWSLRWRWCWRFCSSISLCQCSGPYLTSRSVSKHNDATNAIIKNAFLHKHSSVYWVDVKWVLLSFQGSRWTLQATTMDGNFVSKKKKCISTFWRKLPNAHISVQLCCHILYGISFLSFCHHRERL